jgi:predicted ATPase
MLHNLPQLASNMLGRDGDVTEVRGLIGSRRVVTLVGPGGVGKTRLALQAAAEVLDGAGDGVWWIDLASVDDESLVPAAVAAAVSVPHGPGRPPTETLAEALVDRRLLIVLDNCEHVIEGAAALAAALSERCAGLRILATSRETLRVPGEHVYAVRPLGRETAARLFQQRASERGVRITPADGRLVETVCEKLDGVPLALELAAARVRALGLTELVERLDRRFDLLHVGERTKPPRQRTLQSLIDWSYDLLSGEERRVLSSLSVFPGSFDLAAAEAVAGAAGIAGAHVLDSVASLVDKSLLVAEDASGTVRYRFLETIREYATGKLQESHLDAEIRRAHLTYFCALAEQLQPATRDARQPQALAQLQLEHHNLRGALSACLATGDAQTGLRIATALERFWMFRGLQEGGQWIHDLLALPGAARPPEALTQLSFAVLAHNPADALEIAQEALARAHQQANPAAIALATRVVGYGLELTGDAESAANAFTEAVAQARRCGDPHVLGVCLLAAAGWHNGRTSAASIASSTSAGTGPESEIPGGDFEALLSEARQSADRTGDTLLRIAVIGTFGYHQLASGNLAAARNELASALALASQLGSEMMIGNALVNNGLAAYLDGDRDEASRLFRRAVEPAIARHSVLETANAILGLALVLEDRDPQASAILHGAADARCASAGYQRDDLDERVSTASRMRLRTHLGEQRFAEAMKEGATLALASVIELADRVGVVVPPAPTPSHPTVD